MLNIHSVFIDIFCSVHLKNMFFSEKKRMMTDILQKKGICILNKSHQFVSRDYFTLSYLLQKSYARYVFLDIYLDTTT